MVASILHEVSEPNLGFIQTLFVSGTRLSMSLSESVSLCACAHKSRQSPQP